MTERRVYDVRGMMELGFSERTLRQLIKSERFSEFGYRMKRKVYFILPKVERHIENQMDDYGEVRE